jgi:hypothetical protein
VTLPKHVRELLRASAAAAATYGCTVQLTAKTTHQHLIVLAPDGRRSLKTCVAGSPRDADAHVVQVTQSVRRLCRSLVQ